ncbi:M15 family metallopeptidase [Isoptericola haloaureus]|uniref:M15 family metallopeptidase n=1 Tax=Isoptericola haloaureus TaxID=1542902 RepID=A0ABU7Z3T1_9MICO
MRHARDTPLPRTTTPTATRTSPRGPGRHVASSADRRRRSGPTWSSLAPTSWPLSIGIGIAVTMATTTGMAVADGTSQPARSAAPDTAPSGIRATPDAPNAADTKRDTAAVVAAARQAVLVDREQGASRSGARTARTAPQAAGGIVVPSDATMSGETVSLDVESAPEPPVLPGCDGYATGAGSNGYISSSEMCTLWDGKTLVRADAAVALARLNESYRATFGENMCITDGYRSYALQVSTRAAKGSLAAPPGTSNHGWGLAVDICPDSYAGSRYDWLRANAPAYGWDNPAWARPGGSKYEPWHWEFTAAVAQMG